MKTKVAKKIGFVSMDTTKLWTTYTRSKVDPYILEPTDATTKHKIKIVQNHSPKAKCSYQLVFLCEGNFYHNRRLSGLFTMIANDESIIYKGDIKHTYLPFRQEFLVVVDCRKNLVTLKPMQWEL